VPQSSVSDESSFARLVSLACHDVRTPLATVHGFVKTLERTVALESPSDRYLEMIGTASAQMSELLDELSLAARIEAGRYDPVLRDADTLAIAQGASQRLGADRVRVGGEGATISTDEPAVTRGVSALAQSALRHGGLDEVAVLVRGVAIDVSPVTPASSRVVLGEDLRDLGAAVAVRLVDALGGSVALDGETLTIRLA
jgi:signal transduction histidine kinase